MLKMHHGTPYAKILAPKRGTPFFENFDSKMVVVLSQLWLPLFSARVPKYAYMSLIAACAGDASS